MSRNRYWQVILCAALAAAGIAAPYACKSSGTPLPNAPHPRIVTYSPALTQMVVDLGLGSHLVGVTSQCTVPADLHPAVVGDAFNVGVEAILSVKPDVVLTQIDAQRFEAVRRVDPSVRIEFFKIERIEVIPAAVERIGKIVGREDLSAAALAKWEKDLQAVERFIAGKPRPRVLFVMGYEQPSTGGAGTFISDMIERAGGVNAAGGLSGWSDISLEYAIGAKPDVIVCLLDSATQKADAARKFWAPVVSGGERPVRLEIVTDRQWTIPGLHTAGYVRKLAQIIHVWAEPGEAAHGTTQPGEAGHGPAEVAP